MCEQYTAIQVYQAIVLLGDYTVQKTVNLRRKEKLQQKTSLAPL